MQQFSTTQKASSNSSPLAIASDQSPPAGCVFEVAVYACPLINPPSQWGLFENKMHNIQLAIDRMRPFVLKPGQGFSFWQSALEPIAKNGYREGAMLVDQRATTSIGGGLCQLSGLIYNLALLSGLRIVERHNHSIDAYGEERYIPLGCDSTVAWGYKDLRFENPHNFDIQFELSVTKNQASGSVSAAQPLAEQIHVEVELLQTVQAPLRLQYSSALPGNSEKTTVGLSGKTVRAWRIFTTATGDIRREVLSLDRYRETPSVTFHGDWRAVPVNSLAMQATRTMLFAARQAFRPVLTSIKLLSKQILTR